MRGYSYSRIVSEKQSHPYFQQRGDFLLESSSDANPGRIKHQSLNPAALTHTKYLDTPKIADDMEEMARIPLT